MKEFKKLVEERKVSRCGRWLEIHIGKIGFVIEKFGSTIKQYKFSDIPNIYDQYTVDYGLTFYSKEHAELAKDTMEAEQICRKAGLIYFDVLSNMSFGYTKFTRGVLANRIKKRFGEKDFKKY